MSGTISFNPAVVTNYPNSFSVISDGFVQGTLIDDPSRRFQVTHGYLAPTETLPMWGGVAIYEVLGGDPSTLPMTTPWTQVGPPLSRAINSGQIAGFSVIN